VQYANCKFHNQFKPFTIRLRPRVASALYASGAFTSYGVGPKDQWIDCVSPSVEHYGLKLATSVFSAANNPTVDPSWDVYMVYYVKFRNPR